MFLFAVMRSCLNLVFHCNLGGYNVEQEGSSRSFGGQHLRSSRLTFSLLLFSKGKHRLHNLL
jgi:hypothetical protein